MLETMKSVSMHALMCSRLYIKAKFSTLCKKVCKWEKVVCILSNVKKVYVSENIFNLKIGMGIIQCLKFIIINH